MRSSLSLFCLSAAGLLLSASRGPAQPSSTAPWKELLPCELVVKARYKSHKGSALALEIIEVLRGKAGKPGEVLNVTLSGAGAVQLSPRWGGREGQSAQIPSILFAYEDRMAVQQIPATWDAEEPHIYFFPKADNRRLDGPGQVQLDHRDGWKQALAGKPIHLTFRLLYNLNSAASREAIEELFRTRNPETIADLIDALMVPRGSTRWIETQQFAERALVSLGDVKGDLYEPVLKVLSGPMGGNYDHAYHMAHILARADSKRALADFKALLAGPRPRVSQNGVIWGMHSLDTKEGLDYMIELLKAGTPHMLESLRSMMYNEQALNVSMADRARVQELAAPAIQKIIRSGVLPKDQQGLALFREYFRSLAEPIPASELHWYTSFYPGMNHPARKTFPAWDRMVYQANRDPEPLLNADLVTGRQLIQALLLKPDPEWKADPAALHHLTYKYGSPNMVRRYNKPPEPVVRYQDPSRGHFHRAAHSDFMKLFEETRKLSDAYWARLAGLFPSFPADWFPEIIALLESNDEGRLHFAIVQQLQKHFFWNFDLDPKDFAPVTRRKVAEIKPLLERMSKGDPLAMRAELLRHFGVKLEGPPGKAWLPAVQAAALHWNSTVKINAVHVLGMIEEDSELTSIANHPWVQRKEALEAHLKQTRARGKQATLTPAPAETYWKDLSSNDRATAYAAMQALAASPATVVPWLRKKLREPGQDAVPDAKRCASLIAGLSSTEFKVRSRASEELKKLGEGVVPHLRQALARAADLETRRRIEELLDWHGDENARYHRLVRAVQVLEYTAGPEARALLEEFASGPKEFSVTHEARQALERLSRYWRW